MNPKNNEEAFWKKVAKTEEGCWLWQASCFWDGYGAFRYEGRIERTHRMAWIFTFGPIPEGSLVLHTCDVRACVRPDHLWLGDHLQNYADMRTKGRELKGDQRGERNHQAKLTSDDVTQIRRARRSGEPLSSLAKKYGVSAASIRDAAVGRTWAHHPEPPDLTS
jgi:hypothetical protein